MQAKDIMTSNPSCCTRETSLRDVARMMLDCDCGEIPVVDSLSSMHPVGVITDRDITIRAVAQGKNPLSLKVQDCMSSPCVTVPMNGSMEDCIHLMEQHQIRRIPVVDNSGRCCGIVSQADIARRMDQVAAEVLRQVSQPNR